MSISNQEKSNGTRCSECNRMLTDPKSIANGIGPICIQKVQVNNHALDSFVNPEAPETEVSPS